MYYHTSTTPCNERISQSFTKISCPLIEVEDKKINYQISLSGKYQLDNAILAILH